LRKRCISGTTERMKTYILFAVAALTEIAGCFAF
jgi:hypothetical protein